MRRVSSTAFGSYELRPYHRSTTACDAIAPLAGWLTLATFANIEATLNETRGKLPPRRESVRAIALLTGAGVVGAAVAVASRARNTKVAAVASIGMCAFLAASLFGRR